MIVIGLQQVIGQHRPPKGDANFKPLIGFLAPVKQNVSTSGVRISYAEWVSQVSSVHNCINVVLGYTERLGTIGYDIELQQEGGNRDVIRRTVRLTLEIKIG